MQLFLEVHPDRIGLSSPLSDFGKHEVPVLLGENNTVNVNLEIIKKEVKATKEASKQADAAAN